MWRRERNGKCGGRVMESEWGENDKRVEGGWKVGRESDVRWPRVGDVELGHRALQDFARGMHRHVALSRGFRHGALLQSTVTGHCHRVLCHRIPSQGIDTGYCHQSLPRINAADKCRGATSQRHINKETPDDFSSGVSEERQLPTLPPGLAVPSAMTGLASLFGMGRGGSPSL